MHADLDTLCTAVYCTADDLLPERAGNARRRVTDAEVVTLCVAQAIMGIPSDRRFLAVATKRLSHLFPELPAQPGFHKRRRRLSDTIEWLVGIFASESPGASDDVVLLDSTPVECGRSRETAKRSALGDAAAYGYCRSHSRFFWGMRLHLACAPDGTPRAATLAGADRPEREVGLELLARAVHGGEAMVCDKGYAGAEFALAVEGLGAQVLRPPRRDEPDSGVRLSFIRQRIESVFWTCKDVLTLERHRAHAHEPPSAHRHTATLPRSMRLPQPPARASEPCSRRLCGVRAWNQPSRVCLALVLSRRYPLAAPFGPAHQTRPGSHATE